MTKFVFISGGVVSSLGKGIAASSLAAILEARGLRVTMTKLDPYINVDPGTMSPFQHGEVFVTEDGAETDLDLGHYERFLRTTMAKKNNFTTKEQLKRALASSGIDYEDWKKFQLDELLTQTLISNEIGSRILVGNSEIMELYRKNVEQHTRPAEFSLNCIFLDKYNSCTVGFC